MNKVPKVELTAQHGGALFGFDNVSRVCAAASDSVSNPFDARKSVV